MKKERITNLRELMKWTLTAILLIGAGVANIIVSIAKVSSVVKVALLCSGIMMIVFLVLAARKIWIEMECIIDEEEKNERRNDEQ